MELDTEYDLIVLGTGFVESVIAGAAARSGKKVLHLDYNDYYGGYASSNNLSGFEKVLTANSEGVNAQPEKWPSQTYTCIPAATNPAPKFANVKIYSYTPPQTTETEGNTTEDTKKEETKAEQTPAQTTTNVENTDNAQTKEEPNKEEITPRENIQEKETSEQEKVGEKKEEENIRTKFETREKLMSSSRQFSIDIIPRLLFSRGEMVNLLISSSVGKYLEFKCFEKTYLLTPTTIQPVPCSKGDIFKSKFITNSERLMLSKFMKLIQNDISESGKIDPNEYPSFFDFIKSQKLSPNLEMFVLYAITMCNADQKTSENKVSTAEGLRILELYVSSVSKYGNTPFLCPMYGISELPQAFCRLCAVYAGVYVLRRSAQCVLVDSQTNEFKGIVCSEGQIMKASHFVSTGSYFPHLLGTAPKISRSSRCVVVASAPLVADTDPHDSQATLIIIPPHDPSHGLNNSHAIHILQFDYSLSVTAKGKYLLHFSTEASGTAEQDLEKAVSFFVNLPQMADSEINASKPYGQWVAYFNLNLFNPTTPTSTTYPRNVYIVTEGPTETASMDYKEQLNEAKEVFKLILPEETFLPKVPNPEDVIWGGSTEAETTQTENNGNGGEAEPSAEQGENKEEEKEKKEEKEHKEENTGGEEKKDETSQ